MTDICPACKQPLAVDGEQSNVVRGTVSILGSCATPGCDNFESTFTMLERPMTCAELAKYADLRKRLGLDS